MTQQHPITPPPELMEQWMQVHTTKYDLARQAAQWGADQELEACCEWFQSNGYHEFLPDKLRAARRPKPPSLKEQALEDLHIAFDTGCFSERQADTIRRALEQLPDDA
jgi:hypothetical protein